MYKYTMLSGIMLSLKVHNMTNMLVRCPACTSGNHSKLVWRVEIYTWKK